MKYLTFIIATTLMASLSWAEKPTVDLEISLVKTYSKYGQRTRVIVKYEHDSTTVIIEKIQNSLDDGMNPKLLKSWDLRKVKGGEIFNKIQYIKDAVWKNESTLTLKLESKSCIVNNIDSKKMRVSCK